MNKFVVLVVEDDKPVRNLMSTTLDIHGYSYLTAANAQDAASATAKNPIAFAFASFIVSCSLSAV